ncbi:MAG: hypothetical protein R3247_10670, partial [Rhodothermales bacterium]|nr:hypothetical protein [Rhodothermales bacterium]
MLRLLALLLLLPLAACASRAEYDVVLRGGTLYDGSGGPPTVGDLAIAGDTIAAVGDLGDARGRREIDVTGLAVAPGFINMLSWATESLILDGRAQSDVRQGVTLEVFGEGSSMGPLNETMRAAVLRDFEDALGSKRAVAETLGISIGPDSALALPWTTLGEYLGFLAEKGVAVNVASFVGATTVRVHELGYEDRAPTPEELARMQALVQQAMEEGALGVGASLIYAPAFYASTDELTALAEAAAPYGGRYIAHLRSEGNRLVEAVDEHIEIARRAGVGAEIYHLKAAGKSNWGKLDAVLERIEAARAEGLDLTTDMYTYTAGATGLDAAMPPSVQEGGFEAWRARLQDP